MGKISLPISTIKVYGTHHWGGVGVHDQRPSTLIIFPLSIGRFHDFLLEHGTNDKVSFAQMSELFFFFSRLTSDTRDAQCTLFLFPPTDPGPRTHARAADRGSPLAVLEPKQKGQPKDKKDAIMFTCSLTVLCLTGRGGSPQRPKRQDKKNVVCGNKMQGPVAGEDGWMDAPPPRHC